MDLDEITGAIVDASVKTHIELGPGLLESVYEAVLARALKKRGFRVERQKVIRFEYDGMVFEEGFRADLVVEGRVVVELKSLEKLSSVHGKQVLTYLRLMNLSLGLLINFGAPTLKEGLSRIVNNLPPSASPLLRVNKGFQPPSHRLIPKILTFAGLQRVRSNPESLSLSLSLLLPPFSLRASA